MGQNGVWTGEDGEWTGWNERRLLQTPNLRWWRRAPTKTPRHHPAVNTARSATEYCSSYAAMGEMSSVFVSSGSPRKLTIGLLALESFRLSFCTLLNIFLVVSGIEFKISVILIKVVIIDVFRLY